MKKNAFNVFDTVIVIIGWLDVAISIVLGTSGWGKAFRIFRVLRVFKLTR